jgi:hypothetical protein
LNSAAQIKAKKVKELAAAEKSEGGVTTPVHKIRVVKS